MIRRDAPPTKFLGQRWRRRSTVWLGADQVLVLLNFILNPVIIYIVCNPFLFILSVILFTLSSFISSASGLMAPHTRATSGLRLGLSNPIDWKAVLDFKALVPNCTILHKAVTSSTQCTYFVPCCTMCMMPYQLSIFWSYPVQNTFHANQYLDLQSWQPKSSQRK